MTSLNSPQSSLSSAFFPKRGPVASFRVLHVYELPIIAHRGAPWEAPGPGVLVSHRYLQYLRAPVPGFVWFVSRELFWELGPIAMGSLNFRLPRREVCFQNSVKGAIIQNPFLHWKGIAFHLSFYLQTSQVSKSTM